MSDIPERFIVQHEFDNEDTFICDTKIRPDLVEFCVVTLHPGIPIVLRKKLATRIKNILNLCSKDGEL